MNDYKYLTQRVEQQIRSHECRARACLRIHRRLQLLLVALAALIPLLCGLLTPATMVLFRILIGAMGVAIVILALVDALNHYVRHAQDSRGIAEALRYEQFCYRTGSAPYDRDRPLPLLVDRVESVLAGQFDRSRQPQPDSPADAGDSELSRFRRSVGEG